MAQGGYALEEDLPLEPDLTVSQNLVVSQHHHQEGPEPWWAILQHSEQNQSCQQQFLGPTDISEAEGIIPSGGYSYHAEIDPRHAPTGSLRPRNPRASARDRPPASNAAGFASLTGQGSCGLEEYHPGWNPNA